MKLFKNCVNTGNLCNKKVKDMFLNSIKKWYLILIRTNELKIILENLRFFRLYSTLIKVNSIMKSDDFEHLKFKLFNI